MNERIAIKIDKLGNEARLLFKTMQLVDERNASLPTLILQMRGELDRLHFILDNGEGIGEKNKLSVEGEIADLSEQISFIEKYYEAKRT